MEVVGIWRSSKIMLISYLYDAKDRKQRVYYMFYILIGTSNNYMM